MGKTQLPPPSHEEAVERGRMGGKKKAENQRNKRSIKEALQILLDLPPCQKEVQNFLEYAGIEDEDQTNTLALAVAMFNKAIKGDIKAAEFIRDTVGEKPELNIKSDMNLNATESKVHIYLPDNGRDNKNE